MTWENSVAEEGACFEISFPPLKTTVFARQKLANWIVFGEAARSGNVIPLTPAKPIAWGECSDLDKAKADAEIAMSVIVRARMGQEGKPPAFWPESTTGVIYERKDGDKFLVPGSLTAQRALQRWSLRPYYEGNGGAGQLLLMSSEWAPLGVEDENNQGDAVVWTGAVRDPIAANEMALGLAELFDHIGLQAAPSSMVKAMGYVKSAGQASGLLLFPGRQTTRSNQTTPC